MNRQEQSMHCLMVYLERMKRVLTAMDRGQVDAVLENLRLVDVAFHNFRVLDHQLQRQGCDLAKLESARTMWREVEETSSVLQQRLLDLRKQLNDDMHRSRRARAGIGKYRSGRQMQAEIEQGI